MKETVVSRASSTIYNNFHLLFLWSLLMISHRSHFITNCSNWIFIFNVFYDVLPHELPSAFLFCDKLWKPCLFLLCQYDWLTRVLSVRWKTNNFLPGRRFIHRFSSLFLLWQGWTGREPWDTLGARQETGTHDLTTSI